MRKAHWAIDKVTRDLGERFATHTSIAAVIELVNEIYKQRDDVDESHVRFAVATAASLIFPFAPHLGTELYERLTGDRVWEQPWPVADQSLLVADTFELIVQLNGKLVDRVQAPAGVDEAEQERLATDSEKLAEPPGRQGGRQDDRGARPAGQRGGPVNLAEAEFEYDPEDPDGFKAGLFRPGKALGATRTGISVYELPPGQAVCPYHYEYSEEEWLLVLDGVGPGAHARGHRGAGTAGAGLLPHGPRGRPRHPQRGGGHRPCAHVLQRRRAGRHRVPRQRQAGRLPGGRAPPVPPRRRGRLLRGRVSDQSRAPYLEALRAHAALDPERLYVPGHKGGAAADPELREAIGEKALALDIPALTPGIDVGPPDPTPFQEAQQLAAEAWGAERTWFLGNGASQANHVALLALAHAGDRVVVQRNAHSSTVDGCILAGLTPRFVSPEVDPDRGIAHCLAPETLDRALTETPDAVGATAVSPTYFGAVADVAALAEVAHSHGVPLVVDEAWGAHLTFHPDLPAPALSLGADMVVSSTHKIVGSLTQSAMVHLGGGRADRRQPWSTARSRSASPPAPTRCCSPPWTPPGGWRPRAAEELLGETMEALAEVRVAVRQIEGLDVLDESIVGSPGVFAYDPLRLAIDVRGTGASGYALSRALRERTRCSPSWRART